MTQTTPTIHYAMDGSTLPGDRLLRRIVALAAMTYGGAALTRTALHVGLAAGWLASPPSMGWTLGGGGVAVLAARTALDAGWLLAGLLMRRGRRASVLLLRACAAGTVVLMVVGLVTSLCTVPVYRSYFSTPAAAAMSSMDYLDRLWVPALLVLLTLPPLARRVV